MKFTQVESADGTVLRAPEGSVMRARYSTHEDATWMGLKKNTLLTFAEKDGRAIFFGIARCNLEEGDIFGRKKGLAVAAARLKKAIDDFSAVPGYNGFGLHVSDSLLYGVVPKDKVEDLLGHFKNIDAEVDAKRREKYPPRPRKAKRADMLKEASA